MRALPTPLPLALAALLALTSACAPRIPDGALTPRPQRTTNEARAVDLQVFDAWSARLITLMTNLPADAEGGRRRIAALAAADAWLTFARDEYLREPRSVIVDEAFAQASGMIEAIEQGRDVDAEPRLVTGTQRAHDDLWTRFAELQARDADPAMLGETAVLLVRAGRVAIPGETTVCDPAPFIARARQHIDFMVAVTTPPVPTLVVEATPQAAPQPQPKAVAVRSVYFALDSDTIGAAGREMLDGLVAALEGYSGVTIELQGFADPRGSSIYNIALSRRRATAVQQYLAARTLAVTAYDIRPLGRARESADLSDLTGLARDRRVDLRIVLPDGTEITRVEALEADLQVEAARRARHAP